LGPKAGHEQAAPNDRFSANDPTSSFREVEYSVKRCQLTFGVLGAEGFFFGGILLALFDLGRLVEEG
jgi:hypothetical protein